MRGDDLPSLKRADLTAAKKLFGEGELRDNYFWERFPGRIADAALRARRAGAKPPLEFMGIGAQGVVVCDDRYAYKAGGSLANEAAWLKTANDLPEVRPHVARLIRWDKKNGVIVRECVQGLPGGWSAEAKVDRLYEKIRPHMRRAGWSLPERKADSVVFDSRGRGKIVDAGFAFRVGERLLDHVERELRSGKRIPTIELSTWAFEIRHDISDAESARPTLSMDTLRARRVLEKLYKRGADR